MSLDSGPRTVGGAVVPTNKRPGGAVTPGPGTERLAFGRGAANNADYRDLVRTSLIVDAQYLVLAMMLEYRTGRTTMRSYDRTREQLDAVYASERLRLPFRGVLLVGY